MTNQYIKSSLSQRILTIQLNRSEKKNALTSEMYLEMARLLNEAEKNEEVSNVIIQGKSDLFTSGNDIKDFLQRNSSEIPAAIHFLKAISSFSKPIIAAVGGDAIGIGTTLLLHCDLVVASKNARFQLPFTNLGLCPEAASSYLIPSVAGSKLANQLLMLGDYFDSETAYQAGIVNFIVPEEELFICAIELANKIASKPNDALRTTKRLIKLQQRDVVSKVMDLEFQEFSRLLKSPAAKEIFSAFLEKRQPNEEIIKSS